MPDYVIPRDLKKQNFCPGCGHGIIVRILYELIEELGYRDNVCLAVGVGCSVNIIDSMGHDIFQCSHGRAGAVATGMKRMRPDMLTICYQGDGDSSVIGLQETLNAAYRNENITVITVNNTNFGMTGGQMSWTSLPGEVTTTSVEGRDCAASGRPLHLPEMVAASFPGVTFVSRESVHNGRQIRQLKKSLRKALQAQIDNKGYSLVEVLSPCPTNWKMQPADALEHIATAVQGYYPLGEFKTWEEGAGE